MADKPETLEETQARLARVPQGTPLPPSVSAPIPTMGGQPGTPATRPDPYAASDFSPAPETPTVTTRRPTGVLAVALATVGLLAIGGVVAYNVFSADSGSPSGDEPEYSEEWQNFPGISYIDPTEALTQPSYEEVAAASEALVTQYRDALTAEFGLVWSQAYDGFTDHESNGYGGDSMLYFYDTGSWQGQVQLNEPGARERIFEIFSEIAAANGGDDVLLRNEIYSDDPESSREQFGAAELDNQALWSFFDGFGSLADGYLSSDVIDRNIPVDDSFTGDYLFTYDESSDTLFVTVYGYAGALLKEGDRAAYEDALEPYHGDYEP